MMAAKSIDEMRAELADAGYVEDRHSQWHWRNGYLQAYSVIFPSIDSAYRHLEESKYLAEREKQFQAMRELLEAMKLRDEQGSFLPENLAQYAIHWMDRARRLLATLPDSD